MSWSMYKQSCTLLDKCTCASVCLFVRYFVCLIPLNVLSVTLIFSVLNSVHLCRRILVTWRLFSLRGLSAISVLGHTASRKTFYHKEVAVAVWPSVRKIHLFSTRMDTKRLHTECLLYVGYMYASRIALKMALCLYFVVKYTQMR